MRHHETDVRMSLYHSQGSSSAPIPVLDRYARRLLSCQARVRITGHVWHVFRPRIAKEEA
jgi:hypothetical protein